MMHSSFSTIVSLLTLLSQYAIGFTSVKNNGQSSLLHLQKATFPSNTRTTPCSGLWMATWSDSRAVRDYQDFLSSGKQEIEYTKDVPSVIVIPSEGANELSTGLVEMGLGEDLVVTPDQDIPETLQGNAEFPIYITLPPYQLNDFLINLRESYKMHADNFCFFSGGTYYGNIEDVLKQRGYCRDKMTQVVISGMRVAPNGRAQDQSVNLGLDSQGEAKIAGECAACGKWAGSIAERLQRSSVRCSTDFYREWRRKMWERNVMDAVFHLLGAVRDQPTTLADVANYYGNDVSDIVWEMSQLLRGWRALTLLYGFEERMFGIAEMQGTETPCAIEEEMYPYLWGNQVYLESKLFTEFLAYAQMQKGFLPNTKLPLRAEEDYKSKMRQGNLRADGVV